MCSIMRFLVLFAFISSFLNAQLLIFPSTQENDVKEKLIKIIQSAEKTIDIVAYNLSDTDIIGALNTINEKGKVKIRVLRSAEVFKHAYSSNKKQKTLKLNNGIEEKSFSGKGQLHYKAIIIDHKKALLLTANLNKETFAHCRDFAITIESDKYPEEIEILRKAFHENWMGKNYSDSNDLLFIGYGIEKDKRSLQRTKVKEFIEKHAKKSLYIFNQSYNDPPMCSMLANMAKNGIKIKLIMTPFPFGGETDKNNPFQKNLMENGGEVRFHKEYYIHGKVFIAVDEKGMRHVLLTSCNIYPGSLDENNDMGLIIKNEKYTNSIMGIFEGDWENSHTFQKGHFLKKNWSLSDN